MTNKRHIIYVRRPDVASLLIAKGGEEREIMDQCSYCRSLIVPGERWVREKINDPASNGREPRYHRYHAELFNGQEISCWEKHLLDRENRRTARAA